MGNNKNIILWTDNCNGQNKNCFLYTMFCHEVTRQDDPDTITVKYFEKGHTFISADSFHQIEKGMK